MSAVSAAFDIVLCSILVVLAWRIVASDRLFTSVVLFVVFGLAMSLAYVRLNGVDIALAEAAIGAGLMGALLLGGVASFTDSAPSDRQRANADDASSQPADPT